MAQADIIVCCVVVVAHVYYVLKEAFVVSEEKHERFAGMCILQTIEGFKKEFFPPVYNVSHRQF